MMAFCEPDLRPTLCAYSDCKATGLAFLWKMDAPRDGYGATGLLAIQEPSGQARAYRVGSLELSEVEYPCDCTMISAFAHVTRPAPDVVVVAYFAQTRQARLCNDANSTSTWLLDEAAQPVMAIVTTVEETSPHAVELRRSGDEVRVRVPTICEATMTWHDLKEAANGEAELRSSRIERRPPASVQVSSPKR
ncbi:MAG TPA: hypothetical protein VJV79_28765 [Polyangiaceae bacterium]|nr:hypothetical protein [Polyangiaceae bacterium]